MARVAPAAPLGTARDADADADRRARASKTMVATAAASAPVVDGVLDDATWRHAAFVSDLAQKDPAQDAAPTERTEVAIVFDDDALYVAARMTKADVATLERPLTRRDDTSGAERIIVSLDPYRTGRIAYSFAVTAAGVRADWIHTDDSERTRDSSWNPVWRAQVVVDDHGWTAEMRIPFSQLRFPDDPTPVWGINLNRFIPRTREDDFWVVVPKDRTGWSSYFGELRGLARLRPRLRLEVLPYLSGALGVRSAELFAPGDPFADTFDPTLDAGVDVKLGLGPDLTLDATINPDFGQVEADPAAVNLGAFELTFPEQRPFFVEGAQIFRSNPRSYFYSRRIGAPPTLAPDGVTFIEPVGAARILAAAKLSGQLAPRTNLGVITAATAPLRVKTDGPGAIGEVEVAPRAGWMIARLERALGASGDLAGVTITAVSRDTDDPFVAARLPRTAVTGGADVLLRPRGGAYELYAGVGGSAVAGTADAILRLQTASARYFQRPDADHVEVDPAARGRRGWHADVSAPRRTGAWRWELYAGAESPGLELNDLGVLQSADDLGLSASVSRVETAPGRRLYGWSITAFDEEAWSFGGVHKPAASGVRGGVTLPGFDRLDGAVIVQRPGLSDDATRGGPLMGQGWAVRVEGAYNDDGVGALSWGLAGGVDQAQTDASGADASVKLLWRVVDRFRVQLAPRLRALTAHAQYVTTLTGTMGGADTFGARYLFATLTLREAAAQLRAQLSLGPELTIDAYVEPFVSSGRYDDFGELAAPRARALRRYQADGALLERTGGRVLVVDGADAFAFADPDFTFSSLRSTVVLRWELRPGSVLFAVWQQDRARDDVVARGLAAGAAGDAFTAPGAHVLALKLSWWFAP